jgi:hypothetical protein
VNLLDVLNELTRLGFVESAPREIQVLPLRKEGSLEFDEDDESVRELCACEMVLSDGRAGYGGVRSFERSSWTT